MRKFLLSMALLLCSIGAMAQTVVTTINTDRVYTLKCNSAASDTNHGPNQYIGVTDAGIIDGKSAAPAYVTFEAAESGYYIKVGEKYINYDGSQLTASTEKSTVWVLGTVGNFATFKVNETTLYLNNNSTVADNTTITNLKANNHGANGPSAGNACSTWEMKEYDLRKVLEYENITAMQEVSADDANTIRGLGNMTVIADVTLTNTADPALILAATADYTATSATNGNIWGLGFGNNQLRYIVRSTDGGWYSRGSLSTITKKIAYTYSYADNSTTITYFADGQKVTSNVTVTNDVALSSFTGENAKFYIGGVEHTHSNGWYQSFPGTINSLKIYQGVLTDEEVIALTALEEVPVATPEEFVNGKLYTFTTQRGAMGASATSSNAISTARTTADKETDYFKWTVYRSENNNYYIYNLGKGQFLGEQSTTGDTSVPMSDTPAKVTFKTTNLAAYPLMFKTTDNANCVINHSPNYGEGLITWNGGWGDLNDAGNAHRVIEVSELDETILNEIAAVVNAYENDNTEAKNNLGAAIANVQTLFEAIELGNGLGQYTTSDPQYLEKFQAIDTFYNGITRITSIDEINAEIEKLNNLVATFSLNLPAAGKYYYLKCNGYYLSNVKGGSTLSATTEKTVNNIFYYEEEGENTYLLAYENGQYVTNPWNIGIGEDNINANEKYKQTKSFVEGQVGKYAIEYLADSGDKYYLTVADGVSNATTNKNDNNAQWELEEVTELPVTVSAAGYATLYAPVALTVPSGVKAYTAAINGEWATLTDVNGVIPANTGVVLEGEGNYIFAIAEDAQPIEGNALRGSVATTYYTEAGTYYALAMVDNVVGFYKDEFNNNRFQNNSHKAYLYVAPEAAANVACYSFRFDGTTGIENVEGQSEGTAIYDLMGRRVENPTRGIYVINGKKVLVK